MDFHPMIVHFPIALLSVYSLLEIFSIVPRLKTPRMETVKRFLVIAGILGAALAITTGLLTPGAATANTNAMVNMHRIMAFVTTGLYLLPAIIYALSGIPASLHARLRWLDLAIHVAKHILSSQRLLSFLALAALGSITLTGALGGLMVYGPRDPMTKWLYEMWFAP